MAAFSLPSPYYVLNFGWGFYFIFFYCGIVFFKICSFIFSLWGSSLLLTGFFLAAVRRGSSLLQFEGFSLCDFSYCPAWALGPRASAGAACGLSCSKACRIFRDQPGVEPASPAFIARWILNHWSTREALDFVLLTELGCRLQVPMLPTSLLG